jgi:uncharacterized protein (DUF736 family)
MTYEQKDNSGSLFKNAKGDNPKRPDYTGRGMVHGQLVRISAWLEKSKSGETYLSMKFSEHKPKADDTNNYNADHPDDTIPF